MKNAMAVDGSARMSEKIGTLPTNIPKTPCQQRYRCHLEKNATQTAAISWRLTAKPEGHAAVDQAAALGKLVLAF